MLDAGRAGEVERERALTHGGTCGDDHQLARVQAIGDAIEVGEPGRHTGERAVAVSDRLDLFERGIDQRLERHEVVGGTPLGDGEHLGLRPVDGIFDLGSSRCSRAG